MPDITFGDGSETVAQTVAATIPQGYIVSLLGAGQEPDPSETHHPGVDVIFLAANAHGVHYQALDAYGVPTGQRQVRGWEDIARIHVW